MGEQPPKTLPAGLYIVATPIGNLRDITLRALDVLKAADIVACEDTRITSRLLNAHDIQQSLSAYHDHNAAAQRPRLLDAIAAGKSVALVSDAGTPLISDPGYKLVAEAVARGLPVFPIPGASAAIAGLSAAGLPSDRFLFAGFPPPKQGARRTWLGELLTIDATLLIYEGPSRLAAMLGDLAALEPERPVAVMRELTKMFEEHRHGTAEELAQHYAGGPTPKGELVIAVGPPTQSAEMRAQDLDAMIVDALQKMSVKDAAKTVAEATQRPKKEIYARALALSKPQGSE
jgi:16S rRNA (cytidine1402-2'-O)-methyltransferase